MCGRLIDAANEHLGLPLPARKPVEAAKLLTTAQILASIACGDDVNDAMLIGKPRACK